MNLKILSWNIWFDNDFKLVCDFLASSNADIIGLQEIVPNEPARDTAAFLTSLGYHQTIAPVKALADGRLMSNAVFSKYPITNSQTHVLSATDSRNAVVATIDVNGQTLTILSTHLIHDHQIQGPIQTEQINTLVSIAPKTQGIIMGDFNALPNSLTVQTMLKAGYRGDTEPTTTLDPTLFDCDTCLPEDVKKTRLDYIFCTPDLTQSSFTIEPSTGSDHRAISLTISL